MSDEMKIKLFEQVLKYEKNDFYFYECQGAFSMLVILGLNHEYIQWSMGR